MIHILKQRLLYAGGVPTLGFPRIEIAQAIQEHEALQSAHETLKASAGAPDPALIEGYENDRKLLTELVTKLSEWDNDEGPVATLDRLIAFVDSATDPEPPDSATRQPPPV